jgi:hypothetical protein
MKVNNALAYCTAVLINKVKMICNKDPLFKSLCKKNCNNQAELDQEPMTQFCFSLLLTVNP